MTEKTGVIGSVNLPKMAEHSRERERLDEIRHDAW